MRASLRLAGVVGIALSALVANGCSSSPQPGSSGSTGNQAGTSITIRGCTPQNPLIATNTTEVCGGNPLDAFTAKLVHYNADTAAPELDIAESIETTDNVNFTVKMKKGYKFSDGTEVKAKNFVDAWNWAAYEPNGQLNSYFFEAVDGFGDMACGTKPDPKDAAKQVADCDGKPPAAKTLKGLKVVDDHTFTIKTASPTSNLKVRLGYSAFAPQPDAFFADTSEGKATFAKQPIGAGPYKVVTNSDTEIVLEKFADYSGTNKGSVDKVTFRIYNDTNAAYNDVVASNLDLTDVIPSDQLTNDQWKTDLANRFGEQETGIIQVLSLSPKDENMKNIKMRQALSMAIDRDLVTKQIFAGARVPASGWVSPVVDGYKAGVCPDCTFDKDKAKQVYTEAGGYKGTLQIWVNGDGGHKPWADAVCNQWKNNLGLQCQTEVTPDFATLRKGIKAREYKGAYRGGWQMDYPSIENFLTPIYLTGASSNDTDYSSAAFDGKLKEAAAATDEAKANALYQEAEAILAKDMPTIPLWYQNSQYGWSNKIKSVKMTPFSTFDLTSVTLN